MRRLGVLVVVVGALAVAGCGGDDADGGGTGEGVKADEARSRLNGADKPNVAEFPKPPKDVDLQTFADSIGATGTNVALASSIFTEGHNRIAFGLIGSQREFIYAPSAVYVARGPRAKGVIGPYIAPADLLVTEASFRSKQAATEKDPFAAIYEAPAVELEEPGQWQVLVVSKINGQLVAGASPIRVRTKSPVPAVGGKAPAVETDTNASSPNIEDIDTRQPPAAELHEKSFKDVVGRKLVALLFATPQLCASRVCGPVVDIALQLKQRYGDKVEFIHQEVYVDNEPNKGLRPPLRRFGLPTEPWLFTFDDQGRVAARLEGSFGLNGFDRAIRAALQRSG
jgi:hypothetical protein